MSEIIVRLDGRKFLVKFEESGEPKQIREEKVYGPGRPWETIYRTTYWSAKSHRLGSARTIAARVIEAARQQR